MYTANLRFCLETPASLGEGGVLWRELLLREGRRDGLTSGFSGTLISPSVWTVEPESEETRHQNSEGCKWGS